MRRIKGTALAVARTDNRNPIRLIHAPENEGPTGRASEDPFIGKARARFRRVREGYDTGRRVVGLPVVVASWQFLEQHLPCDTALQGLIMSTSRTQDFVILVVGDKDNPSLFFFVAEKGRFNSLKIKVNDPPDPSDRLLILAIEGNRSEMERRKIDGRKIEGLTFDAIRFRMIEQIRMLCREVPYSELLFKLREGKGRNLDLELTIGDVFDPHINRELIGMGAVTASGIDFYNFTRFGYRQRIDLDLEELRLRALGYLVKE